MSHHATPDFWYSYRRLPEEVQRNYQFLTEDPYHPSLHFKSIHDHLWSVRIGRKYRALATIQDGDYIWFWIGTHAAYDRLIK